MELLIIYLSSKELYLSAFSFALQTPLLGPFRGLGSIPSLFRYHYASDEISEPFQGIFSIFEQAAIPLRLDDDDASFRDAMIVQHQQLFFVNVRQ